LQTARRFPDRPALIWREHTWTWADFSHRVQAAAGALAARGVRHGDRVLLHARNSNAVLETMFASWVLGAVWVPTNFRLTPPEVAYLACRPAPRCTSSMRHFPIMRRPRRRKTQRANWRFPSVRACWNGTLWRRMGRP
jgi:acyl-CoA synthetase (AMP-forming)/AMP-acid ligase II